MNIAHRTLQPMISPQQVNRSRPQRSGYTLIELLVVITIMVILISVTAASVSFLREADRAGNAAGQVQSFLAGARDRAIYAREPRGVRFFIEQTLGASGAASRTVTSMAYIAPGGTWGAPDNSGGVDLERVDINGDGDFEDTGENHVVRVVGHFNPGWWNLKRRGWLVNGLRIRIPAGPTGNWYTVDTSLIDVTAAPAEDQVLLLEVPYADEGNPGQQVAFRDLTYELELPPRLLAQESKTLPDRVVIDLDGSRLPTSWMPSLSATDTTGSGNSEYSGYMDIMFSPRGNVIGDAAAAGLIHFYLCDSEDALFLKEQFASIIGVANFNAGLRKAPFIPLDEINPAATVMPWPTVNGTEPYKVKGRRVVSVFTQTGGISVHAVNAYAGDVAGTGADISDYPFDLNNNGTFGSVGSPEPDGLADDPFRFAETGEVTK